MLTLKQFRESRKLTEFRKGDIYVYFGNFIISVGYDKDDNEIYFVVGEEFKTLEEAEVMLYQMYCDEDRLSEGY